MEKMMMNIKYKYRITVQVNFVGWVRKEDIYWHSINCDILRPRTMGFYFFVVKTDLRKRNATMAIVLSKAKDR